LNSYGLGVSSFEQKLMMSLQAIVCKCDCLRWKLQHMYQLHHEPGLVHTGNYALHVVDVESVLDVQPVCLCMKQHFLLMSMLYRNVSCCCISLGTQESRPPSFRLIQRVQNVQLWYEHPIQKKHWKSQIRFSPSFANKERMSYVCTGSHLSPAKKFSNGVLQNLKPVSHC
jgi:hypothetical protein